MHATCPTRSPTSHEMSPAVHALGFADIETPRRPTYATASGGPPTTASTRSMRRAARRAASNGAPRFQSCPTRAAARGRLAADAPRLAPRARRHRRRAAVRLAGRCAKNRASREPATRLQAFEACGRASLDGRMRTGVKLVMIDPIVNLIRDKDINLDETRCTARRDPQPVAARARQDVASRPPLAARTSLRPCAPLAAHPPDRRSSLHRAMLTDLRTADRSPQVGTADDDPSCTEWILRHASRNRGRRVRARTSTADRRPCALARAKLKASSSSTTTAMLPPATRGPPSPPRHPGRARP